MFGKGYIRNALRRLDAEFHFKSNHWIFDRNILKDLLQGTAFVEYLRYDCITFHKEKLPPCLLFKRFEVNLTALLSKSLSFTRWKQIKPPWEPNLNKLAQCDRSYEENLQRNSRLECCLPSRSLEQYSSMRFSLFYSLFAKLLVQ